MNSGVKRHRKITHLPNAEQLNKNIVRKTAEEHLREDEDVGGQGGLQHNRHVGGVEELDGVGSTLAAESVGLNRDLDAETLEVDDGGENNGGGNEVHDIGKASTPESLAKSATLVVPGEEEVEEGNKRTLEFWSTTSIDGGGGECLPYDGLANIGSNEERDTRTKAITLLEKFIEENDDESGDDKLDDQQKADTSAEVTWPTIKAAKDVNGSLTKRDNQRED